jgi:arylsulfatase A-like enzyme
MIRLLAAVSCLLPFTATAAETAKPNVLVIVADDLGYGDIGVHGGKVVPTPHIDELAASGVRCTNGYVSAPYCSPARAGLLTGRYQTRFGHEFNPHVGDEATLGLPLDERTITDRLRSAGYRTAAFGKWHLGFSPAHHPQSRGFDEFFGFLVGGHNFLLHKDAAPKFGSAHSHDMIYRGRDVQKLDGYTTDLFTDEALAFMRRDEAKPWLVYLAFNAVHTPLEIADKLRDRIPDSVTDPARRGYLSLLLGLDDAIGRVRSHLRESGQEKNTLVFFVKHGRKHAAARRQGTDAGRGHPCAILRVVARASVGRHNIRRAGLCDRYPADSLRRCRNRCTGARRRRQPAPLSDRR